MPHQEVLGLLVVSSHRPSGVGILGVDLDAWPLC